MDEEIGNLRELLDELSEEIQLLSGFIRYCV
jgi:hypothetical protein